MGTDAQPNATMILCVAGGVAIGLLVANWSPIRAVVYAVIWLVAAVILLYRRHRSSRDAADRQ